MMIRKVSKSNLEDKRLIINSENDQEYIQKFFGQ